MVDPGDAPYDSIAWLREQLLARRALAEAATEGPWAVADNGEVHAPELARTGKNSNGTTWTTRCWVTCDSEGLHSSVDEADAAHIAANDPASVMADIDAKLALLDDMATWRHHYQDDDAWYSCSQAVAHPSDDLGVEPGSGCIDEERAGKPCDCGLDRRRLRVAAGLAGGLAGLPGFPEALRLP